MTSYHYLLLKWKSLKLANQVKGLGEQLCQIILKSVDKHRSNGLDKSAHMEAKMPVHTIGMLLK